MMCGMPNPIRQCEANQTYCGNWIHLKLACMCWRSGAGLMWFNKADRNIMQEQEALLWILTKENCPKHNAFLFTVHRTLKLSLHFINSLFITLPHDLNFLVLQLYSLFQTSVIPNKEQKGEMKCISFNNVAKRHVYTWSEKLTPD